MTRTIAMAASALLVVVACSNGEPLGLSEYAATGQGIVIVMEQRIAALDAEWEAGQPSAEHAQAYWDERLEAQAEALEALRDLEPPDAIRQLAERGLDLYGQLIAAEGALAARVASSEAVTGPEQWWETQEGEAVRVVQQDINELCHIFQDMYDATINRKAFSESPWIPSEMKEVVRIDIGCVP